VGATGLSANQDEYRTRLGQQTDDQIDAWAQELMRDLSIRLGVLRVVGGFRSATRLSEPGFERVFASGGGAPATLGRDGDGRLMVPAVELWALVPGLRSQVPDARDRLVEYLVENFDEIVYV
jgi:hypothetical protein